MRNIVSRADGRRVQVPRARGSGRPPHPRAARQFTASTWVGRSGGQPVDDRHLRPRAGAGGGAPPVVPPAAPGPVEPTPDRLVASMDGPAAVPRRNGELLFEAPWQGRVFGMAVALQDRRVYDWRDFQRRLSAEIAAAETRGEESTYYERWLRAFEGLLIEGGILTREGLDDRTEEFEFGERDEVF